MWTVSIYKALVLVIRTLPLVLVRGLVFAGIAAGMAVAGFAGAWIGHRIGRSGTPDFVTDAEIGAMVGLALVALLVALRRDWLLHAVQARSIALMVDCLDGKPVPFGPGQIPQARAAVIGRFGSQAELHALDRLIRGVTGQITSIAEELGPILPLPFAARLASGRLVERVILAQAYRARPENAWEAAHDALVLYTQNARAVLTSAAWITVIGWLVTAALTLLLLAPYAGLAAYWPEGGQAWVWLLAGLSALAIRAALIEPFAFACLMQVFLRITEGQDPLPEWRGRLTQLCDRFRQLGERAVTWEPATGAEA